MMIVACWPEARWNRTELGDLLKSGSPHYVGPEKRRTVQHRGHSGKANSPLGIPASLNLCALGASCLWRRAGEASPGARLVPGPEPAATGDARPQSGGCERAFPSRPAP